MMAPTPDRLGGDNALAYDLTINTATLAPGEGIAAACAGVRVRVDLLTAARQRPSG